jgi:hypothetical protein
MFGAKTSIDLDPEIIDKAKRYCKQHTVSLSHFIEEAIIEKIIKSDMK